MPAVDQVLMNPRLYLAGVDYSGDVGSLALSYGVDGVENTTANSGGTHIFKGGLKTMEASFSGMVYMSDLSGNAGNDELGFPLVGLNDQPFLIGADPGTEGEPAYFGRTMLGKYEPGAAIGEMLKYSLDLKLAAGSLRRGTLLVDDTVAKTASGNGTAFQLGAVLSTQKVYACLQVLTVSGTLPTIDLLLQSDNASGFSSPTTVITFDQMSAYGAQWQEISGAITDDWFRASWTIGGTGSPSFLIALGVAIA